MTPLADALRKPGVYIVEVRRAGIGEGVARVHSRESVPAAG